MCRWSTMVHDDGRRVEACEAKLTCPAILRMLARAAEPRTNCCHGRRVDGEGRADVD